MIYCFNASTGAPVYTQILPYAFNHESIAIADGKMYVSIYFWPDVTQPIMTSFLCLNAFTGAALWQYPSQGNIFGQPTIADGKVYCFGPGGLFCFGGDNHLPDAPLPPLGPTQGSVKVSYTFSTVTTDFDGNAVRYGWDWNNDLVVDEWTNLYETYPQQEYVYTSHIWNNPGYYEVRVKAKDVNGGEGNWSAPLVVSILPPDVELAIDTTGGVRSLCIIVENIGVTDASSVQWNISIEGGVVLQPAGGVSRGTIQSIPAGNQETIHVRVFGFGKTMINAMARTNETDPVHTKVPAFMFGPFIFTTG
jgi:hypothetical protein